MNRAERKAIEWNSSFSVGVKLLDKQHSQIIDMINLLIENSELSVNSEIISDTLDKMINYAKTHFKTEENLLKQYGYPELITHKQEHTQYLYKISFLCEREVICKSTVPNELLDYLIYWWTKHILNSDMKYKSFFAKRGVN